MAVFEELGELDVLFIDPKHRSKVKLEVNSIFFEGLLRWKPASTSIPSEYFKEWTCLGWAWQEGYLIRAFLKNNPRYLITYFQDFMLKKRREHFAQYFLLSIGSL